MKNNRFSTQDILATRWWTPKWNKRFKSRA